MRNENRHGIALMLGATAVLTVMDAIMKHLVAHYSPLQLASMRGMIAIPFLIAWVLYRERRLRPLFGARLGFQLARGLLGLAMITAVILALRDAPLSEVYTLFFVAPLLGTALSVLLLRERVSARSWVAIAGGFLGVLVVLRPGLVEVRAGSVAAVIGAACYALNAVAVRILGRTESAASMAFWLFLVAAGGGGILAWPGWRPVSGSTLPLLLALGVTGTLGHILLTEAFRRARISVVAPFEYFSLCWALGLDVLVWRELPPPIVFVGCAIIVGCGLLLLKGSGRGSR